MRPILLSTVMLLCCCQISSGAEVNEAQVRQALSKALRFFDTEASDHGGYVWRYSLDMKLREGEAETPRGTVWVQPPGTPSIGETFLDAYEVTQDPADLVAAYNVGQALLAGQLQSGGWYYSIHFDPEERRAWGYRDNKAFKLRDSRKNKTNITTLDDDTTPAALRFMIRLDQTFKFERAPIHEATLFALDTMLEAQHPSGGWSQNWDRHPTQSKAPKFPVLNASYPDEWSRTWGNDWTGKYYLNDNVLGNMVETMLLAWEVYGDERYLKSAEAGGDFLIRAQMPAPQRGWAQQYNEEMHPVWDRKFEPPAISSDETHEALVTLLLLYSKTGEKRFLEPIPAAFEWLDMSTLKNGQLARFYELETNRPLYFEVIEKVYHLTYNDANAPDHYAFKIDPKLEQLKRMYRRATTGEKIFHEKGAPSDRSVAQIIQALDDRGAWVQPGNMKGYNKASKEGVVESATFIKNVEQLLLYLKNHS